MDEYIFYPYIHRILGKGRMYNFNKVKIPNLTFFINFYLPSYAFILCLIFNLYVMFTNSHPNELFINILILINSVLIGTMFIATLHGLMIFSKNRVKVSAKVIWKSLPEYRHENTYIDILLSYMYNGKTYFARKEVIESYDINDIELYIDKNEPAIQSLFIIPPFTVIELSAFFLYLITLLSHLNIIPK